jgi:membrane protein
VPAEAYRLLDGTIRGLLAQPRHGLLSAGAVLALWSASSACVSLMDALNQAYRVSEGRPWWRVRLEAVGLTAGLSLFLIVAFALALFGGPLVMLVAHLFGPAAALVSMIVRWVIVIAFITLVITTVYYFGPDVEQRWRWLTPGSVLVTIGFGATSAAFSYYVSHFGSYNKTYGSLGAVIILLFWMYLFAVFLLLGGQVNALLDRDRTGERA